MAPKKQKQYAHPPKKSKEQQIPETENDFLETADEFESSGSKWKAGDSVKALRFYQKAITTYEDGLKKYPKSFDLAYNKALLLYNITQDFRIASELGPLLDVLKEALDAHRYALKLDAENADVLFNTAQVLTSFAEELNEVDEEEKDSAMELLQEAVELFSACLSRQEMEFSEMQELMDKAMGEETSGGKMEAPLESQGEGREESEWATVKEPVTPNTLIDTALAQLGSLSSLANTAAPTSAGFLENLTNIAKPIVTQKLPAYIDLLPTSVPKGPKDPDSTPFLSISGTSSSFVAKEARETINPQATAKTEADLAVAVFTAAIAGSEYLSTFSTTPKYHENVTQAFQSLSQNAATYPESTHVPLLSAYADALIDFADNVANMEKSRQDDDAPAYRWKALEDAQTQLTQATSKLPNTGSAPTGKSQLYYTRANIELLRRQLTLLPSASKALKQNEAVLLKNAGVYYRGAAALGKQEGNQELERDAEFRGRVVTRIEENKIGTLSSALQVYFSSVSPAFLEEGMDEMIEEGLIGEDVKMGMMAS